MNKKAWYGNAVVYHLYVRSFCDSNGDGIGDLEGIISKLDYLKGGSSASLDIDAIWLSPVYVSPMKDFGYDIADYRNIDPSIGTLPIFKKLLDASHDRNIKILMDFVPNHTSSIHPWFLEARSSKNNPKRDWYIWQNSGKNGKEPNNWISVFGGSAWEFDNLTGQYYLHTFDKDQPDLNWRNEEVKIAMNGILSYWLEMGVDGFRIDAPYFMYKHNDFLDEPVNPAYDSMIHEPFDQLLHPHTYGLPEVLDILKFFNRTVNRYPGKVTIAEIYVSVEEMVKIFDYVASKSFSPFNFMLINLPWNAAVHRNFISLYESEIGNSRLSNFVLGNHDKPRIVSRIGRQQARNAAILLFTLGGISFIYNGDELGMSDGMVPGALVSDPFGKNFPGARWGRDPQRTPMQWDKSHNAGFSKGKPWLPVNADYVKINAEDESTDPHSMLTLYRKLIRMKKNLPELTTGRYRFRQESTNKVFLFERYSSDGTILVALNYDASKQRIRLPYDTGLILTDTLLKRKEHSRINLRNLELKEEEGLIIKVCG